MSIQVALHHATRYRYDRPVKLGAQVVRLRPAPHCRTRILAYSLTVEPHPHFLNWQQDPQSNWLARIVVPEATEHLTVTVDLTAELNVINPFDFFLEPEAESYPFDYPSELMEDLKPYFRKAEVGARFREYLAAVPRKEKPTTAFLFDLNAKLQSDISYLIRMEPGIQTPDETLSSRAGSCRDSAWLLVQLLRHLGLAARFASGYLIQLKPDVKSLDGPSGAEQDFTDLHAWCEVYLAGCGMGRPRSHFGPVRGRRSYPARLRREPDTCGPHHRRARRMRSELRIRDVRHAGSRAAARDEALHAGTMARHRRIGRQDRCAARRWRCAPDDGRRTHLRLHRRHGRRGMDPPPPWAPTSAVSPTH